MVDAKLVITVAPQKDIWPQGKIYPKKAVPIKNNNNDIPTPQVSTFLNEEFHKPRAICK